MPPFGPTSACRGAITAPIERWPPNSGEGFVRVAANEADPRRPGCGMAVLPGTAARAARPSNPGRTARQQALPAANAKRKRTA